MSMGTSRRQCGKKCTEWEVHHGAANPGLPLPSSGEIGTYRPARLPCVLEGDSRGCDAAPQAHVVDEVETINPPTSLGEPLSHTLLSSSGVSRPFEMIVVVGSWSGK